MFEKLHLSNISLLYKNEIVYEVLNKATITLLRENPEKLQLYSVVTTAKMRRLWDLIMAQFCSWIFQIQVCKYELNFFIGHDLFFVKF